MVVGISRVMVKTTPSSRQPFTVIRLDNRGVQQYFVYNEYVKCKQIKKERDIQSNNNNNSKENAMNRQCKAMILTMDSF